MEQVLKQENTAQAFMLTTIAVKPESNRIRRRGNDAIGGNLAVKHHSGQAVLVQKTSYIAKHMC